MTLSDAATAQLLETFRASGGAELIREAVELVLQELIETEATAAIGAARYERTHSRTTARNGPGPDEWAAALAVLEADYSHEDNSDILAVAARRALASDDELPTPCRLIEELAQLRTNDVKRLAGRPPGPRTAHRHHQGSRLGGVNQRCRLTGRAVTDRSGRGTR